MAKVFDVYLEKADQPESGAYAELSLPATPYQIQDAFDKLRLEPGKLPASPEALTSAPETVGAWDCRVPVLSEMISDAEVGIDSLNDLAQRLADMEPKDLSAYKALLEATDCKNLQSAEALMDSLDEYIFSPQYSSPIEVAKGELSVVLCAEDAAFLAPYLNLYRYGQALIERCGGSLTAYGLIEREDHQPVQTMENKSCQGEIEMFL